MYQTNYVKAASTDEAVGHMSSGGQLLAGGMTLIPTMKQRLASPETVVDPVSYTHLTLPTKA